MKLISQQAILETFSGEIYKILEDYGRVCYKSEDKQTDESAEKFIRMLIKNGHHSVIEHCSMTYRFITNRGVTHELVRHRLASFSQESTRYVNYGGKDMEFIYPVWFYHNCYDIEQAHFIDACRYAEQRYKDLLTLGWKPQQAREVLPNALKTEIIVTANVREWRHIFKLRCSKKAHPQMRALMIDALQQAYDEEPVIFDDLAKEYLEW